MQIKGVYDSIKTVAICTVLLFSISLGGCATSTSPSSLMNARAELPPFAKPDGYLSVEDLPPKRSQALLAPDEQSKIKASLIATRKQQAIAAEAQKNY